MFSPPPDHVPTALEVDLRERWLPSAEQMEAAERWLRAHPGQQECYSAHLLLNKVYGFWTAEVTLEFIEGIYPDREGASQAAAFHGWNRYVESGVPLTGGWARHFWLYGKAEAAVWEDILVRYPEPSRG